MYSVPTPITSVTQMLGASEVKRVGRKLRRPTHNFNLATRPWQIQPFMIAPVLPGETMQNALMQARVVTDPLADKLVGWFAEYYFFYVKLSDLDDWESLSSMLVTGASIAGLVGAADVADYHDGRGVNFTKLCLNRIVDEYFRSDGELVDDHNIDDVPIAAIGQRSGLDSLIVDGATNDTGDELPGENPSLPAHMTAFADHFAHWEAMRDMQLVDATFEDWLEMMGVKAPAEFKEESRRPELLRYVRQWTYPSNTIDPTSGAATSACSWSIAERLDKKRFFKEPGFLIGVTVCRPKVYHRKQEAALAHYMDIPYAWLPAVLKDTPFTSLREFSDTQGPLAGIMATAYWLDMNDLYQHGDQFVNYAIDTVENGIATPTAAKEVDYATATDADAMFAAASPANKIRQDGVCKLAILSAHSTEDHTL